MTDSRGVVKPGWLAPPAGAWPCGRAADPPDGLEGPPPEQTGVVPEARPPRPPPRSCPAAPRPCAPPRRRRPARCASRDAAAARDMARRSRRAAGRPGVSRATCRITSVRGKVTMPGERDEEAEAERGPRQLQAARETVDDAAHLARPFLLEDLGPSRRRPRACARRSARPTSRARRICRRNDLPLDGSRRMVVVEVEPDLAESHDAALASQRPAAPRRSPRRRAVPRAGERRR